MGNEKVYVLVMMVWAWTGLGELAKARTAMADPDNRRLSVFIDLELEATGRRVCRVHNMDYGDHAGFPAVCHQSIWFGLNYAFCIGFLPPECLVDPA